MSNWIEEGRLDLAVVDRGLNTYPVILVAIGRAGFDVARGAAWWSVFLSSLAVVPLFGLICRGFGRQIAVLACAVYAVHPGLIAYSPHVLREPTHWFLFLLGLYLFWRAAAEARMWLFVAAGVTLTLAVHTRSEAWLLLIPLAGWVAWRWRLDVPNRGRLVSGTAVCLAVLPLSIWLVNVTWLRGCSGWVSCGSGRYLVEAGEWAWGTTSSPPSSRSCSGASSSRSAVSPMPERPVSDALRFSTPTAFRKVAVRFPKALSPVFGLLTLAGLWGWRRRLFTAMWLPLPIVAGALLAVIAIRMTVKESDPRYYLTAVLVLLPFTAAGLLGWSQGVSRLAARVSPSNARVPGVAAGICVLLVVLAGSAEGLWRGQTLTRFWEERVELGKWIAGRFGPAPRIVDNSRTNRLVVYYAKGELDSAGERWQSSSRAMLAWISSRQPTVLLLWEGGDGDWPRDVCQAILDHHGEIGYRRVPPEQLPPQCRRVVVLVRDVPEGTVAAGGGAASRFVRLAAADDAQAYPGFADNAGALAPVLRAHAHSR